MKVSDEEVLIAQQQLQRAEWAKQFARKALAKDADRARRSRRFFEGKRHPILGRHVASIPIKWHYFLKQKYGNEALTDPEFQDWLRRRELKPEGMSE